MQHPPRRLADEDRMLPGRLDAFVYVNVVVKRLPKEVSILRFGAGKTSVFVLQGSRCNGTAQRIGNFGLLRKRKPCNRVQNDFPPGGIGEVTYRTAVDILDFDAGNIRQPERRHGLLRKTVTERSRQGNGQSPGIRGTVAQVRGFLAGEKTKEEKSLEEQAGFHKRLLAAW